jgi:hypothetical protein
MSLRYSALETLSYVTALSDRLSFGDPNSLTPKEASIRLQWKTATAFGGWRSLCRMRPGTTSTGGRWAAAAVSRGVNDQTAELRKITARADSIAEIVREVTQTAQASEGAKSRLAWKNLMLSSLRLGR